MILDIIVIRNKMMKCYANPTYIQEKLDNLQENMTRSLISSEQVRLKYKGCALYHFGTFDDVTGKYNLKAEPELLFDCDDIIAAIPEDK